MFETTTDMGDETPDEAARRRAAAVARMREMVAEGEIDFSVLDDDGPDAQVHCRTPRTHRAPR